MRLKHRFRKEFFWPLLRCVFISIVFTIATLYVFANNLVNLIKLVKEIEDAEFNIVLPYFDITQAMIFRDCNAALTKLIL